MTLQIELVAADRVVWSGEAKEVLARTAEGEIGILTDHAPLLSVLSAGVVEIIVAGDGEKITAAVEDGFISVADNRVSILSEETVLAGDIDKAAAQAELEAAQADNDDARVRRAEAKLRAAGL